MLNYRLRNTATALVAPLLFGSLRTENVEAFPRRIDLPSLQAEIAFSQTLRDLRQFLRAQHLAKLNAEINSFRSLPRNWDSFGAAPVRAEVLRNACAALDEFDKHRFIPFRVSPTADESVVFEIRHHGTRYVFELFRNGEIAALKKTGFGDDQLFDFRMEDLSKNLQTLQNA